MISKNFSVICLVAGFSLVSCNKNENRHTKNTKDSSVVSEVMKEDQKPVQDQKTEKTDSSAGEDEHKDDATIAVSKKTVDGTFVASNCDGGRFSIEFKNTGGQSTFKIFDKKKIIAAGNVSAETDEKTGEITNLEMGEIGGLYQGDKIIIQNYGNSMNEFDHFTQCGDKYLEFNRIK
ncbi:hypothetical protein [Chryseobacterium nepalense]|uniref:Lipoprotein n=1 Tax=Chryseobacterium nepalense TaxID=1854498 RepID=A0ABY4K8Y5_9FLAO|nr:hypothetical protein [Chryseobacterium nepalense]MEC5173724.1 hypothetical protein [Chryseobacterium nepalense]UPQ77247.1 hypothetical protein M0D58_06755 [Chryseobacterium nepalense]